MATEDIIGAIEAARQLVLDLGPQPLRIEITSANLQRLREHLDFEEWERQIRSERWAPAVPGPQMGWALTGVPVVVNNDLPAPGYQIIYSDGSTKP